MFEAIGIIVVWLIGVLFVSDIFSFVCDFIGFCKRYDYDEYKKTERREK